MSGYLTRLLAGAAHPQRAVRPRVAPLFGPPSAGPEWLLREGRGSRAKKEAGGVDAEHKFDGGAVSEDSPAAMPAPSPARFAAAGPTPMGAADAALPDPRIRARNSRGAGRSAGHAGHDAAHTPSTAVLPSDASNEAREDERSHPRVHEQVAASRDATRTDTAPDDGAIAPLLDRWRARRPPAETLRLDRASAEQDPGSAGRPAPRPAALMPPTGEGGMPESAAAPVRIARLPPHRNNEIEPIRRYTPRPPRAAETTAAAETIAAAEAMAVAVRPASPAQSPSGRDTGLLGAAARRARPAASVAAQRHGAGNRHGMENRHGVEIRHGVENRHGADIRRADPGPTVHVTIGTVEIKAGARSNPPRPRPASPTAPRVGLEEYLRRRRTGDPS